MKWSGSGWIGLVLMLLGFWQCNSDSRIVIVPSNDTCNSIPLNDQGVVILEMPQPFFSVDSGAVAYGTKVVLHANSMPNPGIYEMSLDSGKTWKALECLLLPTSLELWGRTRYKSVVSPITKVIYSVYYERVLIVGNSIMRHEPLPEKAWLGNWGMAASAPENDFVHLLSTTLRKLNPNVEIRLMEAVDFERDYQKYDFSKLSKEAEFSPTLLIMRIAENSNLKTLSAYESRYDQLIKQLIAKSDHCKVICTTSFWSSTEEASWPIRSVARNKGYYLADLYELSKDKTLSAYSFFADPGVGSHPSDKGMKAIADKISAFF